MTALLSSLNTVGVILGAMAFVALIEAAIPLHQRGRWNKEHLGPNLALTFLTFATNSVFNVALVLILAWTHSKGAGLLHLSAMPALVSTAVVVIVLDFAFYVAHVTMHAIPGFWRYHSVHHSDPAVDVTTTIRQHPGESVIRYVFMAAPALALGASPAAFSVYRVWSVLNGLLEHANIRVPRYLDILSWVVTTPNMHKVHHSRIQKQTDSNYGNIFAIFDRLFATYTPCEQGLSITYGLDGLDNSATQTTAGLLALPFRQTTATAAEPIAAPQLS